MPTLSWIQNALLWSSLLGYSSPDALEPESVDSLSDRSPRIEIRAYPLWLPGLPIWLVGHPSVTRCTTVLTARSGARFDPQHGGSAARAALLATCRLISDDQFPDGTIFAHPELGGDDAIIWIHHRPQDLLRVLHRLGRILDGSPAPAESMWALQQLLQNQRPHDDPCSCITACCCGPRHRIRQRMIEALDPLPSGARRSGCSRRRKKLTAKEIDRWRIEHIRVGNVAMTIETSLDIQRFEIRQHLALQVRRSIAALPVASVSSSSDIDQPARFIEPVKTLISPPVIEPESSQRVIAGWIVDRISPAESIPLLEPRIEIWDEILLPHESARIGFMRLQARRRASRIDFSSKPDRLPRFENAKLALRLLRRNDPAAGAVLSRRARRTPIVTVLRHERWP